MQHFFKSMQECNSKETSPCAWKTRPPGKINQSFSCKMRYCPLTFPDELHETSRAVQSSRRPRMSCRTMCICCLTSASAATPLRSSSGRLKDQLKRPHFTPSHATKSCILSRPRVGVPLPTQHFLNEMQARNSKVRSPFAWKTRPPSQDNQSLSCRMRYRPLTFPDEVHETSRAMQCCRRPRLSFHTMCICCLTSASTATPLRASSAGWKGRQKWPHLSSSMLPQAAPLFSHDVRMLFDLGKHCYAPPRFERRMERSAKVAPCHSLSCDQVVHREPTASRGTPAHAALSQ